MEIAKKNNPAILKNRKKYSKKCLLFVGSTGIRGAIFRCLVLLCSLHCLLFLRSKTRKSKIKHTWRKCLLFVGSTSVSYSWSKKRKSKIKVRKCLSFLGSMGIRAAIFRCPVFLYSLPYLFFLQPKRRKLKKTNTG